MTPEEIKAMIEAIKGGDGAKALELLEAQLAAALASNAPAPPSEATKPPPEAAAAVEEAPPSSRGAGYAAKDDPAPGTPAAPPKEPSMGMAAKAEEEANAKAAKALARVFPGLSADQRKYAETNCKTPDAVESYARTLAPSTKPETTAARMGLGELPGKDGKQASVRARARAVPTDPEVLEIRNYASPDADTNGIDLSVPGHFLVLDPAKRHAERVAARTNRRAMPGQKGAAQ